MNEKVFHKFSGKLSKEEKYVDSGYKRYKLTSKVWWQHLPDNPVEQAMKLDIYYILHT